MNTITIKAPAKINLSLDVTGRRKDGYHFIESIFQDISIFDTIVIEKLPFSGIELTCSDKSLPCNNTNIAFKAAELFQKYTENYTGLKIYIEKNIPSQAGLGGGSSDGASVLKGLNELFNSNLSITELNNLGSKISADTSYFIYGSTAYVTGLGEIITPLPKIEETNLVVVKGHSGISTPEAYKKIDNLNNAIHPDTKALISAIKNNDFINSCSLCSNIFEQATDLEDIKNIKADLMNNGAICAVMSGSGSSVFGIFQNKKKAETAALKLENYYEFSKFCKTL